ncbi:MAG: aminotransferase class I/II-fold pyridoxal phosphate-dependent enzyme [Nevskiaceae bacterium]|jgi:alanine-synthesizing transaminase|nr:aminotransferase class I/II-fold pyridoxal phosphate-dependent enzyme [Nevskiaceae bacterium]
MTKEVRIPPSDSTKSVRYEIRGALARRALELERQGYEIISVNIGNPGAYGFRTPEALRLAMIENMPQAEGYSHQKGIYPAREALLSQQQARGARGASTDTIFIGNGSSELIDMTLRALLNDGDEVLVPAPDYPLWTAAVTLNGGRAVHYACRPENRFYPDPAEVESLITPRTRALVVIDPNNPTGAVYPREVQQQLVRIAEKHHLVIFSDEIYDGITYEGAQFTPIASLVSDTLCATLSGLSKVYRAAGYRVGWVSFSGATHGATDYLAAVELLASMRMCSNVPAQWAIQSALGGYQSIADLCSPGGRLYESRKAVIDAVSRSRFLKLTPPDGALYAFIGVKDTAPNFDDRQFALELLEQQHVLITPGATFNVPYNDHFRTTLLPDAATLTRVFERIDAQLEAWTAHHQSASPVLPTDARIADARGRFR